MIQRRRKGLTDNRELVEKMQQNKTRKAIPQQLHNDTETIICHQKRLRTKLMR